VDFDADDVVDEINVVVGVVVVGVVVVGVVVDVVVVVGVVVGVVVVGVVVEVVVGAAPKQTNLTASAATLRPAPERTITPVPVVLYPNVNEPREKKFARVGCTVWSTSTRVVPNK
jgi:hypothetical protein